MKRNLVIITIVLIIIICLGYLYWVKISDPGQFEKYGHTSFNHNIAEINWPIYASYSIEWKGYGEVELEKVEFIKKNDTTLKDNQQIEINAFVTKSSWGAFPEEYAIKKGRLKDLEPIDGFVVKNDEHFELVVKVSILSENFDDDINKIRVTFNKVGKTYKQDIPFEGFLAEKE